MITKILASLFIFLLLPISAHAILIDNGDLTVTQVRNDGSVRMWLKDANFSQTSGFHPTGDMPFNEAMSWIDTLNSTNYLNFSDWRLPQILPVNGVNYDLTESFDGSTDNGYNITSPNSELAYMFYVELGNLGTFDINQNSQPGAGLFNTGPFINIQPAPYWSGNEFPTVSGEAWNFHFNVGLQNPFGSIYFPWAVRSLAPIPEPSTLFLLASGLTGLAAWRRKKAA